MNNQQTLLQYFFSFDDEKLIRPLIKPESVKGLERGLTLFLYSSIFIAAILAFLTVVMRVSSELETTENIVAFALAFTLFALPSCAILIKQLEIVKAKTIEEEIQGEHMLSAKSIIEELIREQGFVLIWQYKSAKRIARNQAMDKTEAEAKEKWGIK